jgi:hypothetical protein
MLKGCKGGVPDILGRTNVKEKAEESPEILAKTGKLMK